MNKNYKTQHCSVCGSEATYGRWKSGGSYDYRCPLHINYKRTTTTTKNAAVWQKLKELGLL